MVLKLIRGLPSPLSVDPQNKDDQTLASWAVANDRLDCLKVVMNNNTQLRLGNDLKVEVRGVLGEFGAGVVFDVWEEDAVENIRFTK